MATTRQLAAIMFADIAGFTALMQADEAQAIQLQQKLRLKLETEVSFHHGRILQFRGDGALCSFSSTLEAIQAALAIQLDMRKSPQVPLRIGIHTGDVIISGDNVYGDGVNIASRMESLAEPGSIFITAKVYDDIKNQKDIQTMSLGKYKLKNVRDDIEIYAISHPGIIIPEKSNTYGKGEKVSQQCILVLPFVNLSDDKEQEYFSDGLTEELISGLSRLKEMRIISRTTSMQYKGTLKDVKTIYQETTATYVLEGSVRKNGNQLRITAQFIDAKRDVHLWANSYRGTLDDIFDIQEKVSAEIIDALRLQLTKKEKDQIQRRYTENTAAYQLYLQGRYFWNKRSPQALQSAIRYFENAIKLDNDYALAWVGLADSYNFLSEFTNQSRRELFPKAKEAVQKALELDDQLAEAHISLGSIVMVNEWDWAQAGNEYQIGLELNPNYATGHHWYGEWLLYQGRTAEAIQEISIAVSLDPVSMAILKDLGLAYYYSRQYDEGIAIALKTLEIDSTFIQAYRLLSLCYHGKGMFELAIEENKKWGQLTNSPVKTKVTKAHLEAAAGHREEAEKMIEDIRTNHELMENDYRGMAIIYAALGEIDAAFEWLELSFQRREASLCSMKVDPKMEPLRKDPRFNEMLRKVGLLV